jgi:ribosomal-protein-alanine N-acetyltransferase
MSALWRGSTPVGSQPAEGPQLIPMTTAQLDRVMAIEVAAYAFPWTRGNFIDSIAAGYDAQLLVDDEAHALGYFVAMEGVDEMHLLNITVAPAAQRQGHARRMLAALTTLCRERAAKTLWLEVRSSNDRARAMYARLGFSEVGLRKGYYPAGFGRREDAVVMSLAISSSQSATADPEGRDVLE